MTMVPLRCRASVVGCFKFLADTVFTILLLPPWRGCFDAVEVVQFVLALSMTMVVLAPYLVMAAIVVADLVSRFWLGACLALWT